MSEGNGIRSGIVKKNVKKIVLAYSGGLDTSIIIPWLKENYKGAEVVGVCTDVGQNEDLSGLEAKAKASGASKLYILDLREEFARDYLFPMLRSGAIYEEKYLLGTSIARPLQAKAQVEVALKENADAVSHGCTGKGNDQVRFELAYKALAPQLVVIAPWRMWNIRSREEAIDYAKSHGVPLGNISKKNIYSRDMNAWHISHEGGDLEDPWNRPQESMFQLTRSLKDAPDRETEVSIDFEKGIPVAVDGNRMSPFQILTTVNKLGAENGIGRSDVVENRRVGMKSRGVYETPGGTILFTAAPGAGDADPGHRLPAFQADRGPDLRGPRLRRQVVHPASRIPGGVHGEGVRVHHGHRAPGPLQREHHRCRTQVAVLAVPERPCLFRSHQLRPRGRHGVHQPLRASCHGGVPGAREEIAAQ